MTFDVIIPTKNRQADIYRLLDSIYKSTVLPSTIIIVDQSTTSYDLTGFNNSISVVHHYDPSISGASVARNVGIEYSKADCVYILDDDLVLDENFFEVINKYFKEFPDAMGICGRQKNSRSSRLKVLAFSFFHIGEFKDERKKYNSGYIKKGIYPVHMLSGGIVGYRRKVFEEYLFDDLYINGSLGEDADFSYRVAKKYPIMFAADALALHNHSQIGRYDVTEDYACKIASYALFFRKNITKSFYNWFCYMLVIVGVWVDASSYSAKHRNLLGFKGILKGYSYIKHDFEGVPFIDCEKFKERYVLK